MDFRYRLMRFMSGRNGPDELFALIFAVSVILSVINIFVRSSILQIAVYAVMLLALFRLFSRNTERRRRENEKLLSMLGVFRRKKAFTSKNAPINATYIKSAPIAKRFCACLKDPVCIKPSARSAAGNLP